MLLVKLSYLLFWCKTYDRCKSYTDKSFLSPNISKYIPFIADVFIGRDGQQGVIGPKGDRGDAGSPGRQGLPGAQGIKGERGAKGDTGERGMTGAAGARGPPGTVGSDGEPGVNGKWQTWFRISFLSIYRTALKVSVNINNY